MLHQLENLTMSDLCTQVGEWSLRNFKDRQASDLGVVEELGELTHGILKRFQGIRGFDDPVKFIDHTKDALADMGIYLLNLAGTNGLLIQYHDIKDVALGFNDRRAISQLLMGASLLVEFADNYGAILDRGDTEKLQALQSLVQKVWDWTHMFAFYHSFDFRTIVTETWLRVRQRDWDKNKTHAHLVAEAGGTETPTATYTGKVDQYDIGSATPEPGAATPSNIPTAL